MNVPREDPKALFLEMLGRIPDSFLEGVDTTQYRSEVLAANPAELLALIERFVGDVEKHRRGMPLIYWEELFMLGRQLSGSKEWPQRS